MSGEPTAAVNPRIQAALDELEGMILKRYPHAQFQIDRGLDDPGAVHLTAIVDVDDIDAVLDLIVDRMMEFQIDEALPIFVLPVRPADRAAQRISRTDQPSPRETVEIQELRGAVGQ